MASFPLPLSRIPEEKTDLLGPPRAHSRGPTRITEQTGSRRCRATPGMLLPPREGLHRGPGASAIFAAGQPCLLWYQRSASGAGKGRACQAVSSNPALIQLCSFTVLLVKNFLITTRELPSNCSNYIIQTRYLP